MINTTNLLSLKLNSIKQTAQPDNQPAVTTPDVKSSNSGLISAYLNNLAMMNVPAVKNQKTQHRLIIIIILEPCSEITKPKFLQ